MARSLKRRRRSKPVPSSWRIAKQGVDSGVEQKDFVEDGEVCGPRGFEPAEVDGESDDGEDEKVAPVAVLLGVVAACVVHEGSDGHGENGIGCEPMPVKGVCDHATSA